MSVCSPRIAQSAHASFPCLCERGVAIHGTSSCCTVLPALSRAQLSPFPNHSRVNIALVSGSAPVPRGLQQISGLKRQNVSFRRGSVFSLMSRRSGTANCQKITKKTKTITEAKRANCSSVLQGNHKWPFHHPALQKPRALPVCTCLAGTEPLSACRRPGAMALFTLPLGTITGEEEFSLQKEEVPKQSILAGIRTAQAVLLM